MPGERESMIFPFRWFDTLSELDDTELRAMLAAIKGYASTGEAPAFKGAMKALWNEIKQRIDYDNAKREAISELRRQIGARGAEFGKLGGRPRKQTAIGDIENPQKPQKTPIGDTKTPKNPLAEAEAEALAEANNTPSSSMQPVLLDVGEQKAASGNAKKPEKIFFDYEGDARIHGITAEQIARWREQFPALDIEAQLKAASAWLDGNRKNRKTDIRRFLTNWLIREQDRAKTVNAAPGRYGRGGIDYEAVKAKIEQRRRETEENEDGD